MHVLRDRQTLDPCATIDAVLLDNYAANGYVQDSNVQVSLKASRATTAAGTHTHTHLQDPFLGFLCSLSSCGCCPALLFEPQLEGSL
eukprot:209948-Pelagomonas_calceolata.AAC.2